ncbi:hypothetical protein ANO14919_102140 [Xylariales sp. No.14919]|nr:hypothetical protein F5X98DRAFT_343642 [Xylaria grammica]GAW20705.1 hypothetical protein ANO14919_102140 [Xylariales sp. No.14919]
MLSHQIVLAALSAVSLVSAQANSNSTFTIDPSSITTLQQSTWCNAQQDSCSTLCGSVLRNDCETSTLDFLCECAGEAYPDMNKYQNTIPWFVCTKLQNDCTAENAGDANAQKNCTATYGDKCGTEDVNDHKGEGAVSATTTSSSTSAGSQATSTTSAAPSSSTSEGAAPTAHIKHIGNGAAAVALGLLAYAL